MTLFCSKLPSGTSNDFSQMKVQERAGVISLLLSARARKVGNKPVPLAAVRKQVEQRYMGVDGASFQAAIDMLKTGGYITESQQAGVPQVRLVKDFALEAGDSRGGPAEYLDEIDAAYTDPAERGLVHAAHMLEQAIIRADFLDMPDHMKKLGTDMNTKPRIIARHLRETLDEWQAGKRTGALPKDFVAAIPGMSPSEDEMTALMEWIERNNEAMERALFGTAAPGKGLYNVEAFSKTSNPMRREAWARHDPAASSQYAALLSGVSLRSSFAGEMGKTGAPMINWQRVNAWRPDSLALDVRNHLAIEAAASTPNFEHPLGQLYKQMHPMGGLYSFAEFVLAVREMAVINPSRLSLSLRDGKLRYHLQHKGFRMLMGTRGLDKPPYGKGAVPLGTSPNSITMVESVSSQMLDVDPPDAMRVALDANMLLYLGSVVRSVMRSPLEWLDAAKGRFKQGKFGVAQNLGVTTPKVAKAVDRVWDSLVNDGVIKSKPADPHAVYEWLVNFLLGGDESKLTGEEKDLRTMHGDAADVLPALVGPDATRFTRRLVAAAALHAGLKGEDHTVASALAKGVFDHATAKKLIEQGFPEKAISYAVVIKGMGTFTARKEGDGFLVLDPGGKPLPGGGKDGKQHMRVSLRDKDQRLLAYVTPTYDGIGYLRGKSADFDREYAVLGQVFMTPMMERYFDMQTMAVQRLFLGTNFVGKNKGVDHMLGAAYQVADNLSNIAFGTDLMDVLRANGNSDDDIRAAFGFVPKGSEKLDRAATRDGKPLHRFNTLALKLPTTVISNDMTDLLRLDPNGTGMQQGTFWYLTPLAYAFVDDAAVVKLKDTPMGAAMRYVTPPNRVKLSAVPTHEEAVEEALYGLRRTWTGNYPELRRMLVDLQKRGISVDESMSLQWMDPNSLYTLQMALTALTNMMPVGVPAADAYLSQTSNMMNTLAVDNAGRLMGAIAWYSTHERKIGLTPGPLGLRALVHELEHAFDASMGMLIFRKAFYSGKQMALRGVPGETGHDIDAMDQFFEKYSGRPLTHANIRQIMMAVYRFSYIGSFTPGAGEKFGDIMKELEIKPAEFEAEFIEQLKAQSGRTRASYRAAARAAVDKVMADHIVPRRLTTLAREVLKMDAGGRGSIPISRSKDSVAVKLLDALQRRDHDEVRNLISALLLGRFSGGRKRTIYWSEPVETLARMKETFYEQAIRRGGERIGRATLSGYGLAGSDGFGQSQYMTEPGGVARIMRLMTQLMNTLHYDDESGRLSSGPIDMKGLKFNKTPEPLMENAAKDLANRMLAKHNPTEPLYEHDPDMVVEPTGAEIIPSLDPLVEKLRPVEDAGSTLLVVGPHPVAVVSGPLGRQVMAKLRAHVDGPTVLTLGKLIKEGIISHDRVEMGHLLNAVRQFIADHSNAKSLTVVDRMMLQPADFPVDRQAAAALAAAEESDMSEGGQYRNWDHFGTENITINGFLPPVHGSDLVSPAGMIAPVEGRIRPISQQIKRLNLSDARIKELAAAVSAEEIEKGVAGLPDDLLQQLSGTDLATPQAAINAARAKMEAAAATVLTERERTVVNQAEVKRAEAEHLRAKKEYDKLEREQAKLRKDARGKASKPYAQRFRDTYPDALRQLVNITEEELYDVFFPKGHEHPHAPSMLQVQTVVMALSNMGIDPLGSDSRIYRVKDRVALPQMVQNQAGDPEVDYTSGYLSALGTGAGKTRIIATLHRVRTLVAKKRLSLFLATTDTPVFDERGHRKLRYDDLTQEEHMQLYDTQPEYRQMVTSGVMIDVTGKAEGVVFGFVKAMGELGMVAPRLDKDGNPTGELVIDIDEKGNIGKHNNGISDGGTGNFRLFRFSKVDDGKILTPAGKRRPEFYPRPGDAVFIDNYELAINQNPGFLRRMFPVVYGFPFTAATEAHKKIRAKAENWTREIEYAAVDPPANFLKMLFLAGADVVEEKDGELVLREDKRHLEAFADVRAQLSFDEADIAGNLTTLGINLASGKGTEGLGALVRQRAGKAATKNIQPSKTAMMMRELGRILHKSRVLYSTATPFKDGYRIPFLERVLYMINPNAKEVDPTILAALVRARPKVFRRYMTQMLSGLGLASFAQLPIRPNEIRIEQMNIADDTERLGHLWTPFSDNPQHLYDKTLERFGGPDFDLDPDRVFSQPRAPARNAENLALLQEAAETIHENNRAGVFSALAQLQPLLFQAGMLDKVLDLGVRLMEDRGSSPITVVDKIGDAFMKRQMAMATVHGIDDLESMLTLEAYVKDQWIRSMPIWRYRPLTMRQERRGEERVGNQVIVGTGEEKLEVTLMRDTLLAGEWIAFLKDKHARDPKSVPADLLKEVDDVTADRQQNPVRIDVVEEGGKKVPYVMMSKVKGGQHYAGRARMTPQVIRLVAEARNTVGKADSGTKRQISEKDITFDVMADGHFEFRIINGEMVEKLTEEVLDPLLAGKHTLLPIIQMQTSDRKVKLSNGKTVAYSEVFQQLSSAAYSFSRAQNGKLVATPRDRKAERQKALDAYQSENQVAMMSAVKSASRGIDMHQIKDDWPQRSMIIFEAGPDGGAVVQMLGRINRTGAKGEKLYIYPNSNYGAYMTTQWNMLSKLVEIAELSTGNREMMLGVLPNFVDLSDADLKDPVHKALVETVIDWFGDTRRYGGIDPVRGFRLMSLIPPPQPPQPGQPPDDPVAAVKAWVSAKGLDKAETILKKRLALLPLETQREFLNTFMHEFQTAMQAHTRDEGAVEIPGKVRALVDLPARNDSTGARQQLSIVEYNRGLRNWFSLDFNQLLVSSDDAKREAELEQNRVYLRYATPGHPNPTYMVIDKNLPKKNIQVRDPHTGSYTNLAHYRVHQFADVPVPYLGDTAGMWEKDYAVDKWEKDMPVVGSSDGNRTRVERAEAEQAWAALQAKTAPSIKDRVLIYSGNPLAFTPVLQTDFGQMRYFNENLKRVSVWFVSLGVGAVAGSVTDKLHGESAKKKKKKKGKITTVDEYVQDEVHPRLKSALSLVDLEDVNNLNDQLAQQQRSMGHEEVRERMLGNGKGENALWFKDIGVMVRTDTHGGMAFNMLSSDAIDYVHSTGKGYWAVHKPVKEQRALMAGILAGHEITDELKLGLLQLMFSDFQVVQAGTADYREAVRYIRAAQGQSAAGGPTPGGAPAVTPSVAPSRPAPGVEPNPTTQVVVDREDDEPPDAYPENEGLFVTRRAPTGGAVVPREIRPGERWGPSKNLWMEQPTTIPEGQVVEVHRNVMDAYMNSENMQAVDPATGKERMYWVYSLRVNDRIWPHGMHARSFWLTDPSLFAKPYMHRVSRRQKRRSVHAMIRGTLWHDKPASVDLRGTVRRPINYNWGRGLYFYWNDIPGVPREAPQWFMENMTEEERAELEARTAIDYDEIVAVEYTPFGVFGYQRKQ